MTMRCSLADGARAWDEEWLSCLVGVDKGIRRLWGTNRIETPSVAVGKVRFLFY